VFLLLGARCDPQRWWPTFVVDACSRRIVSRLGVLNGSEGYEAIRTRLLNALPHEVPFGNEYHALLGTLTRSHCRKQRPACATCPLQQFCLFAA